MKRLDKLAIAERVGTEKSSKQGNVMAASKLVILAAAALLFKPTAMGADNATVRVAAVQCYSEMGETAANTQRLARLIRQGAKAGAKIIVTPECAVQGYAYPPTWRAWTVNPAASDNVSRVAEPIPGNSTRKFGAMANQAWRR